MYLERHGACCHEEEENPQRPDVNWASKVGVVVKKLRCGVGWRTAEGCQHFTVVVGLLDHLG